jgi:hypothetical protein
MRCRVPVFQIGRRSGRSFSFPVGSPLPNLTNQTGASSNTLALMCPFRFGETTHTRCDIEKQSCMALSYKEGMVASHR